ncbi:MAG: phosphoenolpyruvate synthase [Proteobacteria bacterium]|nr:phosphoenolpyruvate synthase [Pseudomonadota bacterium]
MSTDPNVVGGKAAGLARLVDAGANVPSFFALAGDEFVEHLRRANLFADVASALKHAGADEVPVVAARLTERLLQTGVGDELRAYIGAKLSPWGDVPIAVRSSMVGEDSASASFAGQLESFLYRRGLDSVCEAVLHCWASALGERVLVYRLRLEGQLTVPRVGVVVQEMVTGEVSGVIFTAHPVTGRRDHTLVTAAWGLGEGVVSGVCNADDYVVGHDGEEVDHAVADKDLRLVRPPDGSPGTLEESVPEADRGRRCLDPAGAARVAREAVRIQRAFGAPQDIEYTLRGDELFLLQARPITKLPEPENTDGPVVVFDNSNIQESYCGVTTPLTFSFAQRAYASVYEQTMRAVSLPESVIGAHAPMLRNLLGLVRGRVYYNINNWYRGLLLLPSFGTNKEDMEAMMGLTDPVDLVQDTTLTMGQKLAKLPGMLLTLWRLMRQFRALPRSVAGFLADFEASYAAVDRGTFATATFSQLMDKLDLLDDRMLGRWHVPIVNDFYVMMTTGKLRRLLGDDLAPLYAGLMSGEEGIESTEPTKALIRLAAYARTEPALADAVRSWPADADALAGDAEFQRQLAAYIERYGDRVMGELKLETITARTDQTFVFDCLRGFLDRPDLDPESLARRERELRGEAEASAGPRMRKLRPALRKAREAVKNRENMRLARTRMFGLYRDVYAALGQRLAEVDRLPDARDVFFLTVEELRAFHEGTSTGTDLAGLAAVRKAEFAGYAATPEPPHHFSTRGPVSLGNRYRGPDRPAPDGDATVLQGIGCYPGIVEADLRVILSPDDGLDVNGRILTTVRTDPGWAPLFPAAAGILVERGSTLSHSAVVARELGIPAVVGVPGLLQIVEDGEPVRLDGATGTVERLRDAP